MLRIVSLTGPDNVFSQFETRKSSKYFFFNLTNLKPCLSAIVPFFGNTAGTLKHGIRQRFTLLWRADQPLNGTVNYR